LKRPKAILGWIIGGLLAGVAILPLCDLHFDCGCTWPGLGGYQHCDIHEAGPPDCPWCADIGSWVWSMAITYALALLAALGAARRLKLPAIALLVFGVVIAGTLVAGMITSAILGRPFLAGL